MSVNGLLALAYQYDASSCLTQVAQGPQAVGLGYDAAGRRNSLTYPNGTATTYFYDNASRLSEMLHEGPSGIIEDLLYTYDAAGNRISFDRTTPQADLPVEVQAVYNAANQQVQFNTDTQTYDGNGNLTFDGTTTYTWDARNRLVQMSSGSLLASFAYDALGRRVGKTINGVTTRYLYDGDDIVAEIQNNTITATYLRGLDIDEPFLRSSAIAENYHTDAMGSVLTLTDQNGVVQTTYAYDPFGNTSIAGTSANPFQYTGRENDGAGMYYYRARYYNPTLQRFMSEDPIKYLGGDINLYVYVLNKPVNLTDPNGEFAQVAIGAFIGGAIGALRASIAGCDLNTIGIEAIKGAAVGAVAGFTFGVAGFPLMEAAGFTGLAAFDVSLLSQDISNFLGGRKQSALKVIGSAFQAGIQTTAVSFATGGLGRLVGDIGADVSPGFGSFAGRFTSSGVSAQVAIIQGGTQAIGGQCR